MRALIGLALSCILLGLSAPSANAQNNAWSDHARVSINFGVQPASTTFTSITTKSVYLESLPINTTYGVSRGQLFDGGILVRVARGFGVGVAVSSFTKRQDAAVTGAVPHPFFYNTPRNIGGPASGLRRSELVTHIQAAYVISSKRFDVALAGGPSVFNVSQDLVGDLTYTEMYPYDTATFTAATTTKATGTKIGFNAGADVGIKLSRNVGVGVLVRYSRAKVSFPLAGSSADVNADVGGPQATGGLRLFF
jgi:hypothetical protein